MRDDDIHFGTKGVSDENDGKMAGRRHRKEDIMHTLETPENFLPNILDTC